MSLRRWVSVLSIVIVSGSFALAAPKKADKKKAPPTPVAPAKDDAGSAAAGSGAGSAVEMQEDAPPSDMNGTDENPDAPKDVSNQHAVVTAPVASKVTGYPIEEALRPITLPANMSEVSIGVHADVSPLSSTGLLHARYGITSRVQLGLSYVIGGIYDDPATTSSAKAFHPGKAVGVDVTVLLQNWLAIRVGVPVYVDPVAVGLQIGAPIKLTFDDKFALGGFDDLLNIKISKFAPSFFSEQENAVNANGQTNGTIEPNGHLRFSIFGIYQHTPQLAIIARAGIDSVLGSASSSGAGTATTSGNSTFLRGGIQYSPRKYVDVGGSLGFDDLAHSGTFAPEAYLALRI
ncbi:MAG: hypothetical protein JO257_20770 [Deltaproteobacteria bacterium]|nr:hypothetical protein [Deltaproteobacteria bacterium]